MKAYFLTEECRDRRMVRSLQEGFQSEPMARITTCPTGAITSFPLQLSTPINQTSYDSLDKIPININFQWGSRTNPPALKSGTNEIDEVGTGKTNITSIIFNNIKYDLDKVEIARASHTNWVLGDKTKNLEDILLVFTAGEQFRFVEFQHLLFVIPIIRGVEPNSYLNAINTGASGTYSLESCFPKESKFILYSSCLKGATEKYPISNVYIFVATDGLEVDENTMISLFNKWKGTQNWTTFPIANPPFKTRFTNISASGELTQGQTLTGDIKPFLMGVDTLTLTPTLVATTNSESAEPYKCVPLDPDKDLSGGAIQFDVNSGLPLSNLLEEREQVRLTEQVALTKPTGPTLDVARLQRNVSSVLGIVLTILIALAIVLTVTNFFISRGGPPVPGAPSTTAAGILSTLQSGGIYLILLAFGVFGGFLMGAALG